MTSAYSHIIAFANLPGFSIKNKGRDKKNLRPEETGN